MIDRRAFLRHGAAGAVALLAPRLAFARAATDRRFVFVIQRGAADALAILPPTGDPAFAGLRPGAAAARLDGTFGIHPALARTAALYREGQALFAHAIASAYRDRSHFDGQNVLETGGPAAYRVADGWLNRLLALLPREGNEAVAIAATVPAALRGAMPVASYAPSRLPDASDDLLRRVGTLYAGDPQLRTLWAQAMETRALTGDLAEGGGRNAAATGALTASLMRPAGGARIATIETGGWDTHDRQGARIATQLTGLDAMIGALRDGLGPAWAETMVLVATEFGRTVALNGTGGTDHGTGAAAMLLGGTVRGGRIVADWPGLSAGALHDGRDLRPTLALDAFVAGALAEHFALDAARARATLFPGGGSARVMTGLARG